MFQRILKFVDSVICLKVPIVASMLNQFQIIQTISIISFLVITNYSRIIFNLSVLLDPIV